MSTGLIPNSVLKGLFGPEAEIPVVQKRENEIESRKQNECDTYKKKWKALTKQLEDENENIASDDSGGESDDYLENEGCSDVHTCVSELLSFSPDTSFSSSSSQVLSSPAHNECTDSPSNSSDIDQSSEREEFSISTEQTSQDETPTHLQLETESQQSTSIQREESTGKLVGIIFVLEQAKY